METPHPFSVISSTTTDQASREVQQAGIVSEIAKPPVRLNAREKKIWAYVTDALHEYGLIHRTDGLMMTIIVRTFDRWVQLEEELQDYAKKNAGSFIVRSPNGYEQPHQLFYAARDLKNELLKWLPEAALTITSFHKIKSEEIRPPQGDLFGDPVEEFRKRGQVMRLQSVPAPAR